MFPEFRQVSCRTKKDISDLITAKWISIWWLVQGLVFTALIHGQITDLFNWMMAVTSTTTLFTVVNIDINRSGLLARMFFAWKLALSVENN